ncbi:MAG: cobyric acid synthase [candidate division NC10 bacterium]|nr:cobyric acid synthase [candidate division NC10 bacterium]
MRARSLMVQGTASHVGKSLLVASLCRILAQDGYRVAPFKAQNMALNSFVTPDGGEIGRAQALQAQAARVTPSIDMNPVLLKPSNDTDAQVIVLGRPVGTFSAAAYGSEQIPVLRRVVREVYERLAAQYEVVVIEGAGSPAEVNLRDRDLTNMDVAEMAEAPVLLVGDIDRGGVFAALIGTLELLDPAERERVQGFIINKFRGDRQLLAPGLDFLVARTGKPVFGVIPFDRNLHLPEEDALPEGAFANGRRRDASRLQIGVIALPHLSNFTDFDPLAAEPDVNLFYVRDPEEVRLADCLILPGSKSTVEDLLFLRKMGLAQAVTHAAKEKKVVVGICGGYQMLGTWVADPDHVESTQDQVKGLGLLPVTTRFQKEKITHQVRASCVRSGEEVSGYEIHHGISLYLDGTTPAFEIVERSGQAVQIHDGACDDSGKVWGSNIHGLFNNASFRRRFLQAVWEARGLPHPVSVRPEWNLEHDLDRWADLVRAHLDMAAIYRLLEAKR